MNHFPLGICVVIFPNTRMLDNAGVHDIMFQH